MNQEQAQSVLDEITSRSSSAEKAALDAVEVLEEYGYKKSAGINLDVARGLRRLREKAENDFNKGSYEQLKAYRNEVIKLGAKV